jgi:hypothetical protein
MRSLQVMETTLNPTRRWVRLVIGLVLLVIALAPRATALGSFSWPDELTWLERSAAFVTAVERGDFAGTYLSDHPGVVPMWGFGGALSLDAWLAEDRTALDGLAAESFQGDVPALLATAAWFTVVSTSLAVLLAYWLLIPLVGDAGAALAGLLIALSPFYLTQSRVVHVDALLASFMLLSVLGLLRFLKDPSRRRYLLLSGIMGGLALSTKTPALFLVPLTGLALALQWLLRRLGRAGWGGLGQVAAVFAAWLLMVWATFVVLWPAAWTRPLYYTHRLFRVSQWSGVVSHGTSFFLGQVVDDPGSLFYWVVLPFRLSPLVLPLLIASLVLLVLAWRQKKDIRLPFVGLSFVLFFTVMVSLAAKKGDRYLLPIFPVADVVTAWAIAFLVAAWTRRARHRLRWQRVGYAVAVLLVLVSSILWLRLAPHYGAYFNPLLGGGPAAVQAFSFGQGEGLDLAAGYLNDKDSSEELLAVSFYPEQFSYYFDGDTTSLRRGDWDKTWLFADYVVFYVSQVQRKLPTAELVDFFIAQDPEYVARLGGVDFARVYRSPVLLSGEQPAVEQRFDSLRLGEELGLVGYALSADRTEPGEAAFVTLYWQALKQLGRDYEIQIRLIDPEGQIAWQQAGPPFDGFFPTWWWRPGKTMYDRYRIDLPDGLVPGEYGLLVAATEPGSDLVLRPHGPTNYAWPDALVVGTIRVERSP